MKRTKEEIANARKVLEEEIRPGDTIFTILRHVSASGMSRSISLIKVRNGETWDITYFAACVLGDNIDQKRGGIKIGGCGMDMGFALVYNLSRVLFPSGFVCCGKGCGSNDHTNDRSGDWDRAKSAGRKHVGDGGYALNQRWL